MTAQVQNLLNELDAAVKAKDRGAFDDVLFDVYLAFGATEDNPDPPLPPDVDVWVTALTEALPLAS
jgi:hypothetical protein